jgi:hypothetical protein
MQKKRLPFFVDIYFHPFSVCGKKLIFAVLLYSCFPLMKKRQKEKGRRREREWGNNG